MDSAFSNKLMSADKQIGEGTFNTVRCTYPRRRELELELSPFLEPETRIGSQ